MTKSKTTQYVTIPIFLIALTIGLTITPMAFNVFADTEGYSGVGSHPTLGLDNRGYTLIEDGLKINGKAFLAEYFSQTINTQVFKVNQQIDITLHYYLKGGTDQLAYTSLGIGDNKELVQIEWNQDFKGIETVSVSDQEFFENVMVKSRADPNNPDAAFLNFKFRISEDIGKSTLKIVSWNANRESWTNYFYDAIQVGDTMLAMDNLATKNQMSDTNEIRSPMQQTRMGISAYNVECDPGKELMIKNNGSPICVNPASVSKLIEIGFAKKA